MQFPKFRSFHFSIVKRFAPNTQRATASFAIFLIVGLIALSLNFGVGYRSAKAAPPADCTGVAQIPLAECNVLIALYTQTNGAAWTNNSGWTTITPCTTPWFGITCNAGNTNVTQISLPSNNLVGTIPTFTTLTNLIHIDLNTNHLSGSIPLLAGLANLNYVDLSTNQLTGPIPSLAGLTNLGYIALYTNQLTGTIPPLTGLTSLYTIDLGTNQLTGSIPSLAGLTNLSQVFLTKNQLTGSIPTLTGSPLLFIFNADQNQLTGPIPSLAGLTNLTYFIQTGNQLTGPVPSLTGLTSLQFILLGNNQLTGTIPTLTGFTTLKGVGFDHNQLTGPIPSLAGLTNLQGLYLGGNQLTGPIPSLTGLTALQNIVLASNQLTGPIPSLAGLTNLNELWLNNNQLSGPVPSNITGTAIVTLNNLTLCGGSNNLTPPDSATDAWIAARDSSWFLGSGCTAPVPTSAPAPTVIATTVPDDSNAIQFDYTANQTTVIAAASPTGSDTTSGPSDVALDVTLNNVSAQPVTGLVLREQIQPGLQVVGITSTAGTPVTACNQITVVVGTLLPGQTALLTVQTQVSSAAAFAPNSSDQPVMYTYADNNDAFSRSSPLAAQPVSLVNVGSASWDDQHYRTKLQIVRVLRPSALPTTGEHPAEPIPSPLPELLAAAIGIFGLFGFIKLFVARKLRARSH